MPYATLNCCSSLEAYGHPELLQLLRCLALWSTSIIIDTRLACLLASAAVEDSAAHRLKQMLSRSKRPRDSVANLGSSAKLSRSALHLCFTGLTVSWMMRGVAQTSHAMCIRCQHSQSACVTALSLPVSSQILMLRCEDTSAAADGLIEGVRRLAAAAAEKGLQHSTAAAASLCACAQHTAVSIKEDLQPAAASLKAFTQQPAEANAQPAAASLSAGVQQPVRAHLQPAITSLNACVRHLPRKWDQQRLKSLLQEQRLEYGVAR